VSDSRLLNSLETVITPHPSVVRTILRFFISFVFLPLTTFAQGNNPARITEAIDETQLTVLKGNTHPLARPEFDRGPAPRTLPLDRMLLVLRRSPQQEAALQLLLDKQQDKSSPEYHNWLTPEKFGQQFGPADQDLQTVISWLESHGFRVGRVAKGRTVIEFSGTASQLQSAFHTEIHQYMVNGGAHWANSQDPQIPSALVPVVAGVATLHNFLKKPQIILSNKKVDAVYTPGVKPQVTFSNGVEAIGPGDFATIYNLGPLYNTLINNSPISGWGTTIAVVGRTNINVQDVRDFYGVFDLNGPGPDVYVNGPDPGDLGGDEEAEAVLDTSWSGAVAPGALVELVVSASTNTTDGIDLSELEIIDNAVGNVMTESFSGCEQGVTSAEASNIASLAEQAAAQGITYVVSTGDNGAEGCDSPTESSATGPISVNVLASSAYTVAVGGTQFNENGKNSTYWSPSTGTITESAKSYIPEDVWNESCTTSTCPPGTTPSLYAGSGGASVLFTKPSWQSGVSGIPSDNARDLPDVALNAAVDHDPYLICLRQSCQVNSQGQISLELAGGTSAAAPAFAGIMALVNQKTGVKQGQANYVLYRLASQETLAQCNASSQSGLPTSSCTFNDVTVSDNSVPGEAGYGAPSAKYQAGVGYDLASGLGSVNAANLVNNWGNARSTNSVVSTFTLTPTTNIQHGTTPVSFNVTVTPQTGTGTPTGDVSLIPRLELGELAKPILAATLVNGSVSGTTQLLPGGTYPIFVHYEGDGTFLPSDSATVQVTVTPEGSSTVLSIFQGSIQNPTLFSSGPYGVPFALSATVTGQSGNGTPTGNVEFFVDGNPAASDSYASLSSGGLAVFPSGSAVPLPGQHSLTATYTGDNSFNPSTSTAVGITITQASTQTTLQSNIPTAGVGQTVILTASVAAAGTGNAPTGTVKFFSGQTQVGTGTVSGDQYSQGTVVATATLSTNQLPFGQDSITAQYSGDANYQASTAPAISVTEAVFVITANPGTIFITSPGQSGSTTLTFTAQNGFTGSSALTSNLCSNLPSESSCTFSPSTVTFGPSASSATVTLTVNTQAASRLTPWFRRFLPGLRLKTFEPAIVLLVCIYLWLFARQRQLRWSAVLALIALVMIGAAAGCGGGSGSSSKPPPPSNPGTPIGNYNGVTVTVTISGVKESINNLSVAVE
jgi:Pro-kumamolisin, activation domain/Bacterial Ig-like domain (group 3)